jgi:hypothetical protein
VVVLDAAGLAAPSVVEACLRSGVHPLRLEGQDFLVVLVGAAQAVTAAGLVEQPGRRTDRAFVGARAPRPRQKRPANLLLFGLRGLDRRIKRALVALASLASVSVVVLTLGYREPDGTGMSVLDALYFTIETIGTVGFGDFYFRDQHRGCAPGRSS